MTSSSDFVEQLRVIIGEYDELSRNSQHDDLSDRKDSDIQRFLTRGRAAIERIAGRTSPYFDQCQDILGKSAYIGYQATHLVGVLRSLQDDLKAGYLATFRELVHAELFADFLEMAEHLVSEGYKDAAAVIAGSSLEAHLRQLCAKAGIPTDRSSAQGTKPKKADSLNSELASTNVYSKLDQKNVTAWLDLRNNAAHGRYSEYLAPQVALMVASVRDFITRVPA